jgi:hypothetical protein
VSDGEQAARFLKFADSNRIVDTRGNFLILYDKKLFSEGMDYIWKKYVNTVLVRKYSYGAKYEVTTIPFPGPEEEALSPVRVDTWKRGKFGLEAELFSDKCSDLLGRTLRAVAFPHAPSVLRARDPLAFSTRQYHGFTGVEVEMLQTISRAMNFQVILYEAKDSEREAWGRRKLDGVYTGLLGEIQSGRADFALGNFHYDSYYLKILDLSIPYTSQCFTFLTPEVRREVYWNTLVLPFRTDMWIVLLVTLFLGGFLFRALAWIYSHLEGQQGRSQGQFGEVGQSVLYTYGIYFFI